MLAGCGGGGSASGGDNRNGLPVDRSVHQSGFVNGAGSGVRLHYLDWGGNRQSGETVLLLPGLGDNAHIYDDLAPRLIDRYRVVALTRRGFGESDQPTTGYDVDTLTSDVKALLDQLGIDKAHIIGHSVAGNEMTRFAALYPHRVRRLVYLDAAFERTGSTMGNSPASSRLATRVTLGKTRGVEQDFTQPAPTPADFANYAAARNYYKRISVAWSPAFENSFRQSIVLLPDGSVAPKTPDTITGEVMAQADSYRAEFGRVSAPALALFASPDDIQDLLPWFPANPSPESRAAAEATVQGAQALASAHAALFDTEAPNSIARVIPGTVHYLFIPNDAEIVNQIREFLAVP
jgi:pimeloyl-ACP methyl ester carboxylesterase